MNPTLVTVVTLLLTTALTHLVSQFPSIFVGFDSPLINAIAGSLASLLIVWVGAALHHIFTHPLPVVTAAMRANGGSEPAIWRSFLAALALVPLMVVHDALPQAQQDAIDRWIMHLAQDAGGSKP